MPTFQASFFILVLLTFLHSTDGISLRLPPPPLHTCPAAARIELIRTKHSRSFTSSKKWKKEMDQIIQIMAHSGGGFSAVTARLRAESPLLAITLKTPSKQPYRPPSSHFFSCSDPRVAHAGLFTFGGDLGEFIIALAAVEQAQKQTEAFQQQDITLLLSDYLKTMTTRSGKTMFYACTDDASLERKYMFFF